MKAMLVALLLGGCAVDSAEAASSDPPSTTPAPTSSDLRAAIDSDLGNVIAQTTAAIGATTTNLPGAMSAGTLAQLFGSSAAAVHQLIAPLSGRFAWPGGGDSSNAMAWLDANVLSTAPVGDNVYAIPASLVCGASASAECTAAVAQAQPRVRVAPASGGNVQLFVQLGAAHDEPLAIVLSSNELTATIDLDAAGRDLGAPFSGNASLDLKVSGAAHITASLTFGSAIAVGWGGASLTSAAGSPLTVDLDGGRPQIAATLAFGATTLGVADTTLAVPGLAATVGFDGHALTLDRISLGDQTATLAKAGAQAIAIDLNPNAGRTFGAVLSNSAGVETIAVAPSLEIRQQIDHGVLGDGAPVYDVTDLSLDAALHGSAGSDQVEVVHGTYDIATAPASYGVTGTDARCIVSTPSTTSSGESYDLLAVATCQ
ncbi:MAG TPA: hypothetical protein VGL61_18000 [Kofleriaceae bacterium]|jgi:hypothetical protein